MNNSERAQRDRLFATLAKGKTRFLVQWGLIQNICIWAGIFMAYHVFLYRPLGIYRWLGAFVFGVSTSYLAGQWVWDRLQVKSRDYPS